MQNIQGKDLPERIKNACIRSTVPLTFSLIGAKDDELIFANDAFCKLTGFDQQEIIGQNCRFLQHEDTLPDSRLMIRRFLNDDFTDRGVFEISNRKKSGEEFENLIFMYRIRNASGKPLYMMASQFQIPFNNAAREAELRAQMLENKLSDINRLRAETGLLISQSVQLVSDTAHNIIKLIARSE